MCPQASIDSGSKEKSCHSVGIMRYDIYCNFVHRQVHNEQPFRMVVQFGFMFIGLYISDAGAMSIDECAQRITLNENVSSIYLNIEPVNAGNSWGVCRLPAILVFVCFVAIVVVVLHGFRVGNAWWAACKMDMSAKMEWDCNLFIA